MGSGVAYRALMLGLIALVVVAMDLVFIPLHAPDDADHFAVAWRLAHLELGLEPAPGPGVSSGAQVDAAIEDVIARSHAAVRLDAPYRPDPVHFSGRTVFMALPIAVSLPLLHVPQAVAIAGAERLGLTVDQAILAARLSNAAVALLLIAAALEVLPDGFAFFALLLLCLPKSLQLLASNSTDPLMHALSLGLLALFWRAETGPRPGIVAYALAALAVVALAGERPPLAVLGALPAWTALRERRWAPIAFLFAGALAVAAWYLAQWPAHQDVRCPVDPTPLAGRAIAFARHAPTALAATLQAKGGYYGLTFIGELGYGYGLPGYIAHLLPAWVYAAAIVALFGSLGALGGTKRLPRIDAAWLALVAGLLALATFSAMAIACSTPGADLIRGVQGRYFVEPVLLLALSATAWLPDLPAWRRAMAFALPAFLVVMATAMLAEGLQLYGWPAL